MTSLLLFATSPKTTPNGSLLSKLATDCGTFNLLAKGGETYVLGHDDRYITVVDADDSLSALCLSNQTTLRAIRILANLKSPLRFTVEFQVKDPAFLTTASITLTDEQLKVLGTDYASQLHNEFVAVQYNSTFQKRKAYADQDSTVNLLEPAPKRQNGQGILAASLLLVDPLLPVIPLLPVTPDPLLPVSLLLPFSTSPIIPVSPLRPVSPLSTDVFDLRVLSLHNMHADMDRYTYKVSYREPGNTKMMEKKISMHELLECPGGTKAFETYYNGSLSKKPKNDYRKLKALCFNADLSTYTVSYLEEGKIKKTEKLMTTAQILDLPGGPEAIEKYKALYVDPTAPRIICAFNFNSVLDNYTVKIQHPGEAKQIEKLMTTSEILNLPSGPSAIASYKRLSHLASMNPVAVLLLLDNHYYYYHYRYPY